MECENCIAHKNTIEGLDKEIAHLEEFIEALKYDLKNSEEEKEDLQNKIDNATHELR